MKFILSSTVTNYSIGSMGVVLKISPDSIMVVVRTFVVNSMRLIRIECECTS